MDKQTHIEVTSGMRGFYAVMVHWNNDLGPNCAFWEPLISHSDSFPTVEEAVKCAIEWAEAEELEYRS